jgi:hypothetical protein
LICRWIVSSPSYWCVPAEIRAHMGAVLDFTAAAAPLAEVVEFSRSD